MQNFYANNQQDVGQASRYVLLPTQQRTPAVTFVTFCPNDPRFRHVRTGI